MKLRKEKFLYEGKYIRVYVIVLKVSIILWNSYCI